MSAVQLPARPRVAVVRDLTPADRDRLRDAAPDARIDAVGSLDELGQELAEVDVVAGTVGRQALSVAASLRWVHTWAAGPDAMAYPELESSGVVLTSSAGNGAVPLAEHAMMMMMVLNRDAPRWWRAQGQRRWDRFVHGELLGLTVGIIGLGNAGTELARRAEAFGMRVIGVRREASRSAPHVAEVLDVARLDELAARSDVVVNLAPLTESTRGLLGREFFAQMRPGAFYLCLSRGGIADDDALYDALVEGRIAGAALDAHAVEPLPPDSRWWDLPNVVVTPHNAATSHRTPERGFDIFLDNLDRAVRGHPMRNVVDAAKGY